MATKNTSISLDEHFADFAERQVTSGRYESASDVVRAGFQLFEHEEEALERLRAALIEGEQSGPAEPWDYETFKARMHVKYTNSG